MFRFSFFIYILSAATQYDYYKLYMVQTFFYFNMQSL